MHIWRRQRNGRIDDGCEQQDSTFDHRNRFTTVDRPNTCSRPMTTVVFGWQQLWSDAEWKRRIIFEHILSPTGYVHDSLKRVTNTLPLLTGTICRMTLETVALLAFLSVNLKVIFLALPILPSHVSPQRLRITFLLHMALYKFFILYYIVLYCIVPLSVPCQLTGEPCWPYGRLTGLHPWRP